MNLQTLKNTYAQEQGYEDWYQFRNTSLRLNYDMEDAMNEICIRAQKAALEKAAENAKLKYDTDYDCLSIDINSITNPENLIL